MIMNLALRLLVAAAFLAAILSALAVAMLESPIGVILPLEQMALGGAVAGTLLGAAACWRGRARSARGVIRVAVVTIVIGSLAGVLAARKTFLAYEKLPVTVSSGGVTLAGDIYVPRGAGSGVPAAVLVHGSGRETRSEYAFYARFLARRGIAALAYDKRGAGASQGHTYDGGYQTYADDAAHAFRLLQGTPGIDASRVGFVGFSEAEWVAPLAATQVATPAFLVIIGASGLTPANQTLEEVDLRLARKDFGGQDREEARLLYSALLQYQRSAILPDGLAARLQAAMHQPWFAAAEDLPEEIYPPEDYRWWRGVMDFDAAPLLSQLACPMLFVKGELDDRSDAALSRERILAAAGEDARRRVQFELYPGADHSILRWPLGHRVPPPAFPEGFPERISSWILGRRSG
ncbi:MAG: alpha/beta hydrolase family protein [Gammaproteobacteria bacterium]